MTLLEAGFYYGLPPGDREIRALDRLHLIEPLLPIPSPKPQRWGERA